MSCVRCGALLQKLRSAQSSYEAARVSSFFTVTSEMAASKRVDLERAKSDLFDHQEICRRPGFPIRDAKAKQAVS